MYSHDATSAHAAGPMRLLHGVELAGAASSAMASATTVEVVEPNALIMPRRDLKILMLY